MLTLLVTAVAPYLAHTSTQDLSTFKQIAIHRHKNVSLHQIVSLVTQESDNLVGQYVHFVILLLSGLSSLKEVKACLVSICSNVKYNLLE